MGEFYKSGKHGAGLPVALDIDREQDRNWLAVHGNVNVFLDGEKQDRVVAFNTRDGTIKRHKMSEFGKVQVTSKGKVRTETLRGKVTVEWA